MRTINRTHISMLVLSLGALAIGACTRTTVTDPLITNYEPTDQMGELAYWHSLPSRSAVSNDEGLHGLILLGEGTDACGSYDKRVEMAKARGWLSESFDEPADLAMQRGRVAHAIVGICQIKGGIMLQFWGNNPRYATKELGSMGMLPEGSSELQSITGLEFMSVITRAQDYMTMRDAKAASDAAKKAAPVETDPKSEPVPAPTPAEPPATAPAEPAPAAPAPAEPATMKPIGR